MRVLNLAGSPGATFLLGGAFLLLLYLILSFSGISVWDDSYMFARYADHLLNESSLSWNPEGDSTYGLTSQLHFLIVLLLRQFPGGPASLSVYLASFIAGLAFLVFSFQLLKKHGDRFQQFNPEILGYAGIALAFMAPALGMHLSSGMDTCLSMAWLGGYLLLFKRFERRLSPGKSLVLGVAGGLAWMIRPDLMVFAAGLPAGLLFFSRRKLIRVQALYLLIFMAFSLICQFLVFMQLYDTILPVPFLIKSFGGYGEGMAEIYRWVPFRQFALFILTCIPALVCFVGGLRVSREAWRAHFSTGDRVLMAAVVIYWLYFLFGVMQIMPYASRFFFPSMPAVLYLGAKSLTLILRENRRPGWHTTLIPFWWVLVLGLLLLLRIRLGGLPDNPAGRIGRFEMNKVYQEIGLRHWPYLDRFSKLPDDMSMATTEIGVPGVMNTGRKIVDLAGLTDPDFASTRFDIIRLVREQQPDLIFMPHPHYKVMNKTLRQDSSFQADYLLFTEEALDSYMGIAIRRKSPHFYAMKFIVEDEQQQKAGN